MPSHNSIVPRRLKWNGSCFKNDTECAGACVEFQQMSRTAVTSEAVLQLMSAWDVVKLEKTKGQAPEQRTHLTRSTCQCCEKQSLSLFTCFSYWSIVTAVWIFPLHMSYELWTQCFYSCSFCSHAFALWVSEPGQEHTSTKRVLDPRLLQLFIMQPCICLVSINAKDVICFNQENSGVRRQNLILGRHRDWDMLILYSISRLSAKQEESKIAF